MNVNSTKKTDGNFCTEDRWQILYIVNERYKLNIHNIDKNQMQNAIFAIVNTLENHLTSSCLIQINIICVGSNSYGTNYRKLCMPN